MSTPSPPDAYDELVLSLSRINTYNPPVHTCSTGWSFAGLHSGPTSIAFLFYALGRLGVASPTDDMTPPSPPPAAMFMGQTFDDWAEAYLELGRWAVHPDPDAEEGRSVGVGCERMARLVVQACLQGDESLVGELLAFEQVVCAAGRAGGSGNGNGWRDGRAGYLYLLRVVRARFGDGQGENIQRVIERVVAVILRTLGTTSPGQTTSGDGDSDSASASAVSLDRVCESTEILTQIVLSRTQNHTDGVEGLLDAILDSRGRGKGSDWGEYTPRIVSSLACIAAYFPPASQQRIRRAFRKARDSIFREDQQQQQGGGVSPPTLAYNGLVDKILALADADRDRDRDRCTSLLSHLRTAHLDATQPGWMRDAGRRDAWVGLHTGEAGRAWAWTWAVVATAAGGHTARGTGTGTGCLLGYNDV